MKVEELRRDLPVVYVPFHAHGDRYHPDCEIGMISSWTTNCKTVFVRYGEQANAKATNLEDLVVL